MTDQSVFDQSGNKESSPQETTTTTILNTTTAPSDDSAEKLDKILEQQRSAQEFIATLKEENSAMRGELKTLQEKLADAAEVERLLELQQQNSTATVPEPKTPPVNRDELLADIKSEVLGELTQQEQQAREATNIAKAEELAKQQFGEGYSDYVNQAAEELKLPVSYVQDLAKTSPEAFMNVINSAKKTVSAAPTLSTVNTSTLNEEDPMAYFNRVNLAATLRGTEGMEARKIQRSPEFKQKEREAILARAVSEGRLS